MRGLGERSELASWRPRPAGELTPSSPPPFPPAAATSESLLREKERGPRFTARGRWDALNFDSCVILRILLFAKRLARGLAIGGQA